MWQIFCKVIDNFGDAGVALRLARLLCESQKVALWIDAPDLIFKMLGREKIQNLKIFSWDSREFQIHNGDVVIELFSCHLPDFAESEIEKSPANFLWLAVDYLGLEKWVCDFHLKPSPQKKREKYFYFPSFYENGGGVLFEKRELPAAFDLKNPLKINAFLYDESPLQIFKNRPICNLAKSDFVPQRKFDAALDSAALNLVRGEDSFVRAIFSGQPFVWQAYPQAENAHFSKVSAFLEIFSPFLDSAIRQNVVDFFHFLNGMRRDFSPDFLLSPPNFALWQKNCRDFAESLFQQNNLAENLLKFSKKFGVDRGKL